MISLIQEASSFDPEEDSQQNAGTFAEVSLRLGELEILLMEATILGLWNERSRIEKLIFVEAEAERRTAHEKDVLLRLILVDSMRSILKSVFKREVVKAFSQLEFLDHYRRQLLMNWLEEKFHFFIKETIDGPMKDIASGPLGIGISDDIQGTEDPLEKRKAGKIPEKGRENPCAKFSLKEADMT